MPGSGPDFPDAGTPARITARVARQSKEEEMRKWVCRVVTVVGLVLSLASVTAAQEQGTAAVPGKAVAVVNLNAASVEQLAALPGIGERTAQRIVEYRQKNGPFKKPEDLMNVKGIGEKSFLRLKALVTVGAPKADRASQGL
jgi:comEA protein